MHSIFKTMPLGILVTLFSLTANAQVGELTQTGNVTVCLNSMMDYAVIPTAGSTYTWMILPGSGGGGTIQNGGSPGNRISVHWTEAGTCILQVLETSSTCAGEPVQITVTVMPGLTAGVLSGDQTICYNSIPETLTATEPTGGNGNYRYQWEFSNDGGSTWNEIPGAVSLSYTPDALQTTTRFRLQQSSEGGCGAVQTGVVTVTVNPQVITSPIFHN